MRVDHGPRTPIRAPYGTPEWRAEIDAWRASQPIVTALTKFNAPSIGSLAWLYACYRETSAWTKLSLATRRQRENIFKHVMDSAGQEPAYKITQATIVKGLERRDKTPAQARNFLDAMRGLFKWAVGRGHLKVDPTANIKTPTRKTGPDFVMWTEEDMAKYERRWPIGSKERVWLDVLAYTGLRRGDAVRLGRQHVRDGVATITTEKSRFTVKVTLPILPVLSATLAAGPCGDLTFICGAGGKPLTKESFGNLFRQACRQAGVSGSAHGVRKIAATRAAENRATVAELEAIFGWHGGRMASLYTRDADCVRLAKAKASIHKLANNSRTSIPAPLQEVRAPERKG
jgi:integrase